MSDLFKIFGLESFTRIEWSTKAPNWSDSRADDDESHQKPPEWICTAWADKLAIPYFGHFYEEQCYTDIYCHIYYTRPDSEIASLVEAIAQLRSFEHSTLLFDITYVEALEQLSPATIAAYKTSPQLRESFTRLQRWINQETPKGGVVYLLSDQLGHYKIGHTVNLERRVYQLRTQPPFEIIPLASAWFPDRYLAEKRIHRRFSQYRLRGEWFAFPKDLVDGLVSALDTIHQLNADLAESYENFDPSTWEEIRNLSRKWTTPDTPSDWEMMVKEDEQGKQ